MLRPIFVAVALAAPCAVPTAPAAELPPVRVTTDSAAYCQELAVRIAAQPGPSSAAVRTLAEEGQRLCDTGHVRTGIAKLRRALRASQPAS
jgi:hypothetical protein